MSQKPYLEIDLEDYRSPKYNENIEKYGEWSDSCFLCGRRIKDLNTSHYVHYTTKGKLASTDNQDLVEDTQGAFPVGPDCAKKLVVKFAFKLNIKPENQ